MYSIHSYGVQGISSMARKNIYTRKKIYHQSLRFTSTVEVKFDKWVWPESLKFSGLDARKCWEKDNPGVSDGGISGGCRGSDSGGRRGSDWRSGIFAVKIPRSDERHQQLFEVINGFGCHQRFWLWYSLPCAQAVALNCSGSSER